MGQRPANRRHNPYGSPAGDRNRVANALEDQLTDRSAYHTPVLVQTALQHLSTAPGRIFVDATLGGGGYAELLLEAVAPHGRVIGIDRDPEAIAFASARLEKWGDLFTPIHGSFAELGRLLDSVGIDRVDGVVFDLGVSSHQLDDPDRGFSFRADAPLDMRMDPTSGRPASELIASLSLSDLRRILQEWGEEKWAARIAEFIVAARLKAPIRTTLDLVKVIETAVPVSARPRGIHVATRSFQALRIAVNGELDALVGALSASIDRVNPGGRIIVISYHSLEDRIVKRTIAGWANPCICPRDLPVCGCGRIPRARAACSGAVKPSEEEVTSNPRARSARLRVAEVLRDPNEVSP